MRNIKYEALLILPLTMYFVVVILPNNIVFKVGISVYGDQSGDGGTDTNLILVCKLVLV